MTPGFRQFGVLLVRAQGDSGFTVDPLGSGGVGDDVGGFEVKVGEVAVVVDEVAEVVGEEVTGEGFAVPGLGPAGALVRRVAAQDCEEIAATW